MITVLFRTVLIYIVLIISMRLMGKRQVGELQLSELIVTLMLSDFAATPIYDTDIPFTYALLPILVLLSFEVILSFVLLRAPGLKILLGGRPSFIIRKGKLDQRELSRQRMCLSELISALRQVGIFDIGDVEYAILEENGKLSVFRRTDSCPPSRRELGMDPCECGISHALIIDSRIVPSNLEAAGWSFEKLEGQLSLLGRRMKDILLFSVDDCGSTTIIYKDKK